MYDQCTNSGGLERVAGGGLACGGLAAGRYSCCHQGHVVLVLVFVCPDSGLRA